MARVRHSTGAVWPLPARCVLGRSSACTIRITDSEVSGEHALMRWDSGIWELQDLHSRNGTYVDGHRIDAGQRVRLDEGARLGFGRRDGYVLEEAGPPTLHAVLLNDDRRAVEARDGLLALPDPERPERVIHRQQGQWLLEEDGDARTIEDGLIVQTSLGMWRVYLPESLPSTREATDAWTVASLKLRFSVDRNSDRIELEAASDAETFPLSARAHHLLLLTLAQVRLADRELPPAQQGWIHQHELLRRLDFKAGRLQLDIHRIRRQFAEIGVVNPGHVIERHPGTRQVRIGVAELVIVERGRDPARPQPYSSTH
jgi:pSer/pThr/pTyr-binding forkhead associated (FHA) protein